MAISVQLETTYPRGRSAQCPAPLVKETSRARKRRLWRERQEARSAGSAAHRPPRCEGWAYLPDIVLEEIFKYLTYKVGAMVGAKDSNSVQFVYWSCTTESKENGSFCRLLIGLLPTN